MAANIVVRVSAIVPIIIWLGTMYLACKEPAGNHWGLIMNAMGLPGTLLALAVAIAK